MLSGLDRRYCVLLIKGNTHKEIATRIGVSPNVVSTYFSRMYRRYNLNGQIDLVLWYVQHHMPSRSHLALRKIELVLDWKRKLDYKELLDWCVSPKGRIQTQEQWAQRFGVRETAIWRAFQNIAKDSGVPPRMLYIIAIHFVHRHIPALPPNE